MNPRRITGLLVATLVLHLAFAAQAARCSVPVASGQDHHSSHQSSSRNHRQHDAPSVPACCQALTSCSLTVDLRSSSIPFLDVAVGPGPDLLPICASSSRTATPEAPPPRV